MKFKDKYIVIHDADSIAKAIVCTLSIPIAILLGWFSTKLLINLINSGGFNLLLVFLIAVGYTIAVVTIPYGFSLGGTVYSNTNSTIRIKPPLSSKIIVRQELEDSMGLYYKRWGAYRLWEIQTGNDIALFKNNYRIAYDERNNRETIKKNKKILYEGDLKNNKISF